MGTGFAQGFASTFFPSLNKAIDRYIDESDRRSERERIRAQQMEDWKAQRQYMQEQETADRVKAFEAFNRASSEGFYADNPDYNLDSDLAMMSSVPQVWDRYKAVESEKKNNKNFAESKVLYDEAINLITNPEFSTQPGAQEQFYSNISNLSSKSPALADTALRYYTDIENDKMKISVKHRVDKDNYIKESYQNSIWSKEPVLKSIEQTPVKIARSTSGDGDGSGSEGMQINQLNPDLMNYYSDLIKRKKSDIVDYNTAIRTKDGSITKYTSSGLPVSMTAGQIGNKISNENYEGKIWESTPDRAKAFLDSIKKMSMDDSGNESKSLTSIKKFWGYDGKKSVKEDIDKLGGAPKFIMMKAMNAWKSGEIDEGDYQAIAANVDINFNTSYTAKIGNFGKPEIVKVRK